MCFCTLTYLLDEPLALGLVEDKVWRADTLAEVATAEEVGDEDRLLDAVVETFQLNDVVGVPELVEDAGLDPELVSKPLNMTGRVNVANVVVVTVALECSHLK